MKEKFSNFGKTALIGGFSVIGVSIIAGLLLKLTDSGNFAHAIAIGMDNALFVIGVYKVGELVKSLFKKD